MTFSNILLKYFLDKFHILIMNRKYNLVYLLIYFNIFNLLYNLINNIKHILNIIYKYFVYLIIKIKLNHLNYY